MIKKMKKTIIVFLVITVVLVMGCSSNNTVKKELGQYINNYEEVYSIICDELSVDDVKLERCKDEESEINTLSNFGNGIYWISAKGINFAVACENHIAQGILYNNGSITKSIPTPTYTRMKEEQIDVYENNLSGKEVDPDLIHVE